MSSMMLECPICLLDFIESKAEASSLTMTPCCLNIFCKACLEQYVASTLMLYEATNIVDGAKSGNDNGKMVDDDHDGDGWKPSVLVLYREALYHGWHYTVFLALVAFIVGVTQVFQKLCHGDAHNNHHEHDSPPQAEFTNHDPSMSTWCGIPDMMSSLVSGLLAPAVAITKIVNIHAWLLPTLGCTRIGLIYAVGYLLSARFDPVFS
jgi:hypothetical protein